MRRFRSSGYTMAGFFAKRTAKTAWIWGAIAGISTITSAIGFAAAYPTVASRAQLATTFGSNVGLAALIGKPEHIDTVNGFTAWRALGFVIIVGAVWALLAATKTFRGEEAAGRWEMFLTGPVTARKAALNGILGLLGGILAFYILAILGGIYAGHSGKASFSIQASLFMGLALVASALEFMAVGVFVSQLMPIRARAASVSAAVFAVAFLSRALANTADSLHWLLYVSPLGWVQLLRPLYGSQPMWLMPIGGFVIILFGLSIWMAGRRDLGASTFADKDTAKPRLRLLNAPLPAAFRLTRTSLFSWILSTAAFGFLFGVVTKTAGEAFSSSQGFQKVIGRIAQEVQTQIQAIGSKTFLGIVFFMMMTIMMAYAASAVAAIREDEAEGYLDNLLVRPVGRLQWLSGRLLLCLIGITAMAFFGAVASWGGESVQHAGIAFHDILIAGVNALAPALLILGLGIFMLGYFPRYISIATYGLIAWSFLIEMIGSAINLNHWILDTSPLHHISFAPAVDPAWRAWGLSVLIGALFALVGAVRFRRRDIENE